jgi:hypothetical protein
VSPPQDSNGSRALRPPRTSCARMCDCLGA